MIQVILWLGLWTVGVPVSYARQKRPVEQMIQLNRLTEDDRDVGTTRRPSVAGLSG